MPLNKVVLPALGEGITDATIIRWLVEEGDFVIVDQPLVEIATDKVDSEVYSLYEGILKKIIALPGEVPKVGETIAYILVGAEKNTNYKDFEKNIKDDNPIIKHEHTIETPVIQITNNNENHIMGVPLALNKQNRFSEERKFFTSVAHDEVAFIAPSARELANQFQINIEDVVKYLEKKSTDTIEIDDIEKYIEANPNFEIKKPKPIAPQFKSDNTVTTLSSQNNGFSSEQTSEIEKIPLTRVRKKIAEHMMLSSKTIPHVTSFIEVDVTNINEWREKHKEEFYKKYNTRLTLTHLFVESIVAAIKQYPQINVSLENDYLVLKKSVHIGMATVLPDKNLIVPVIRNADNLNIIGIALAVNDLSERARNYNLKPHETIGSTFTFTNIGIFGSLTGTPLINVPEAAILSIGAVTKKPWAVKTNEGYALGLRDIVILSLAYDHRIIDGSLGGLFLKSLKEIIENFDVKKCI